jgi:hypothetical protein
MEILDVISAEKYDTHDAGVILAMKRFLVEVMVVSEDKLTEAKTQEGNGHYKT